LLKKQIVIINDGYVEKPEQTTKQQLSCIQRHSHESGNLCFPRDYWMPACAGMTVVMDSGRDRTLFQQAHDVNNQVVLKALKTAFSNERYV